MRAREVAAIERRRQREAEQAQDDRDRAIIVLIRNTLEEKIGPVADDLYITRLAFQMVKDMRDKGLLT